MATEKSGEESFALENFAEDLSTAKRDLVLRFVKDQEALQTSQVDLKIVDDETIDLIDSALVAKGEENIRTRLGQDASLNDNRHRALTSEISSLCLDGNTAGGSRKVVAIPRPPSGRPRSRSASGQKQMVSRLRKHSQDSLRASNNLPSRRDGNKKLTELSSPFEMDATVTESGVNLNASWPQKVLPKKFFLRNYSSRTNEKTFFGKVAEANFPGVDSQADTFRPRSSQCFQEVPHGDILSARVLSANGGERIPCNAASLTNPSSYVRKLNKSSRRSRAYIDFNRLETQLSFEGPLGLEPVNPTDLPFYSRSSATSSSVPCTVVVRVPPIGREGPAPSSSWSQSLF